jgi:tRNA G18 (ribose-2'-O)-methylase SpoU
VTGVRGMKIRIVAVDRRYDMPMTFDESGKRIEAIFIAANVAEASVVERLLAAEEIEFDITPEAFLQQPSSNVCLQGLLFEVLAERAESCRHLLTERGFGHGVIASGKS